MAKQIKHVSGSGFFYGTAGSEGNPSAAGNESISIYTVPSGRIAKLKIEMIAINDSSTISSVGISYASYNNYFAQVILGDITTYWSNPESYNGNWGKAVKVQRIGAWNTSSQSTYIQTGEGIHTYTWGQNGGYYTSAFPPGDIYLNANESVTLIARALAGYSPVPYKYRMLIIEEY